MKDDTYEEYLSLVKDILYDDDFIKLKNCNHHGTTRYDHSLKVSYSAYKIAKKYKLSYEEVAISALLHDFFNNEDASLKERFKATFTHPVEAENNARDKFNITEKEAKIIRCHMFPINLTLPRDRESWVVTICDKIVYFQEYSLNILYKLRYSINIFAILLLNFLR
jgi:uncharacterized protein